MPGQLWGGVAGTGPPDEEVLQLQTYGQVSSVSILILRGPLQSILPIIFVEYSPNWHLCWECLASRCLSLIDRHHISRQGPKPYIGSKPYTPKSKTLESLAMLVLRTLVGELYRPLVPCLC